MRIEIREGCVVIDGYVNAVERQSRPIPSPEGNFIEVVRAGTFQKAIEKNDNVKCLLNHNEARQLGCVKDKNLRLFEDTIGLRAILTCSDEEVIKKAREGKLRGWSFGFTRACDKWERADGKMPIRYLEDINLDEVSILDDTKIPAYIATSIEARDNSELTETRELQVEVVTEVMTKEPEGEKKIDYSEYENRLKNLIKGEC